MVFFDNILIYSKSKKEHDRHLRMTLQTLRSHLLCGKFSRSEFWLKQVTFFRHVISDRGVFVDLSKIEAIVSWSRPTTVTEVQSFLGLVIIESLFKASPI